MELFKEGDIIRPKKNVTGYGNIYLYNILQARVIYSSETILKITILKDSHDFSKYDLWKYNSAYSVDQTITIGHDTIWPQRRFELVPSAMKNNSDCIIWF